VAGTPAEVLLVRWKTTTFVATLPHDQVSALWVRADPIGEGFRTYVEKRLIPILKPGGIVTMGESLSPKRTAAHPLGPYQAVVLVLYLYTFTVLDHWDFSYNVGTFFQVGGFPRPSPRNSSPPRVDAKRSRVGPLRSFHLSVPAIFWWSMWRASLASTPS